MLDVGIFVDEDFDRGLATLASLRRWAAFDRVFFLLEPQVESRATPLIQSAAIIRTARAGAATAFNTLLDASISPVVAFLESGARVTAGALERLEGALQGNVALAGPSTNIAWNEQRRVDAPPSDADDRALAGYARRLGHLHRNDTRELTPRHSLADFCLVVGRQPILALGGADDAYDPGPGWEMDLNIRAHRAGRRGLWVVDTYVHRAAIGPLRRAREEELSLVNRRRYQDRFCGRLLRGVKDHHSEHCLGEDCADFAPTDRVNPTIHRDPEIHGPDFTSAATLLVSCILPTRDRPGFVVEAVRNFLNQDYPRTELVVLDDGTHPIEYLLPADPRVRYLRLTAPLTLGAKRNLACEEARGEIIAHVDDDDWYPPDRLTIQARALLEDNAAICGTSTLHFHDPARNRAWIYSDPAGHWLAGASLVYLKSHWRQNQFDALQIGEDSRFVARGRRHAGVLDLLDPGLCVASIHAGNTSLKTVDGAAWRAVNANEIERRLGARLTGYRAAAARERFELPLVSCIMPTRDRPKFVSLALEKFELQDYPRKELIVIDDGEQSVGDLVEGREGVRHLRLGGARLTIGEKRNLACSMSTGEVICFWDDDDWYGPDRLRRQVLPIIYDRTDMTGLRCEHIVCLPSMDVWTISDTVHRQMFESDVTGGTIAFRKSVLDHVQFPHVNLAEDAAFLRTARARGFRLQRIVNHGTFAYMRHPRNTWRFDPGVSFDARGWSRADAPAGLSRTMLEAHVQACCA